LDFVLDTDSATLAYGLFAKWKLPWGVQLYIAAGVTSGLWTWADVTSKDLSLLQGTHVDAGPKILDVLQPQKHSKAVDVKLW
jgi:hypothetical protein